MDYKTENLKAAVAEKVNLEVEFIGEEALEYTLYVLKENGTVVSIS